MIDALLDLCQKRKKRQELSKLSNYEILSMATTIRGKKNTVYYRYWDKKQPKESYFEDYYRVVSDHYDTREGQTLYAICMACFCPKCMTFIPDRVRNHTYKKTEFDTVNIEETNILAMMEYDTREHVCIPSSSTHKEISTDYFSIRVTCPKCKLQYELAFRLHENHNGYKYMRFKLDS